MSALPSGHTEISCLRELARFLLLSERQGARLAEWAHRIRPWNELDPTTQLALRRHLTVVQNRLSESLLPGRRPGDPAVYRYRAVSVNVAPATAPFAIDVCIEVSPATYDYLGRDYSEQTLCNDLRQRLEPAGFGSETSIRVAVPSTNWPSNRQPQAEVELWAYEHADGSVSAVLLRSSYPCDRFSIWLGAASVQPEPAQALRLIRDFRDAREGAVEVVGPKLRNIDGDSLAQVLAQVPPTQTDLRTFTLYRATDQEWFYGTARGVADNLKTDITPFSRFHAIPLSQAAQARRPGLELVRAHQALEGEHEVLLEALRLFERDRLVPGAPEQHVAVRYLARWWNRRAPPALRKARYCRLYWWDERGLFEPCDPEEPGFDAQVMAQSGSYALFERAGLPTMVAQFYRGREHNTQDFQGTATYLASGERGYACSSALHEVDDARYCLRGLQALAERAQT